MKADVLLGLQWGDEGKGKIVDVLTPKYSVIARFQGGPNAGHTLEFDGIKHVLHIIPSGIFHKGSNNIIGNGVVIDPIIFKKEVDALVSMNVPVNERLQISKKAHLILPTHRLLDRANEEAKGKAKIGSTLRGIGPTYTDKIARNGVRVGDLLSADFEAKVKNAIANHIKQIIALTPNVKDTIQAEANELATTWFAAVKELKKLTLIDSEHVVNKALKANKAVLCEGAQGTLLDIDFGSYPMVTSSNTVAAGACTGLGLAPSAIGEVFGIFKAYCTRVGNGPFPTELLGDKGEELRKAGNEFGATTGRPRRCGWIDLVALKYAIMINGVTQLIMTKADVLSGFDTIKACTHYNINGVLIEDFPHDIDVADLVPVYKTIKGWNKDLTGLTNINELPQELNEYILYLEQELQVPITIVSVGPDRTQTLIRK